MMRNLMLRETLQLGAIGCTVELDSACSGCGGVLIFPFFKLLAKSCVELVLGSKEGAGQSRRKYAHSGSCSLLISTSC